MADFSKAAYTLRSWENPAINDYKPYSQDALDDIEGRQGWTPVQGLSPAMPATTIMAGTIVVHNRMVDGFFVASIWLRINLIFIFNIKFKNYNP